VANTVRLLRFYTDPALVALTRGVAERYFRPPTETPPPPLSSPATSLPATSTSAVDFPEVSLAAVESALREADVWSCVASATLAAVPALAAITVPATSDAAGEGTEPSARRAGDHAERDGSERVVEGEGEEASNDDGEEDDDEEETESEVDAPLEVQAAEPTASAGSDAAADAAKWESSAPPPSRALAIARLRALLGDPLVRLCVRLFSASNCNAHTIMPNTGFGLHYYGQSAEAGR